MTKSGFDVDRKFSTSKFFCLEGGRKESRRSRGWGPSRRRDGPYNVIGEYRGSEWGGIG